MRAGAVAFSCCYNCKTRWDVQELVSECRAGAMGVGLDNQGILALYNQDDWGVMIIGASSGQWGRISLNTV